MTDLPAEAAGAVPDDVIDAVAQDLFVRFGGWDPDSWGSSALESAYREEARAVLSVPAVAAVFAMARTCERDMARLVEERDEAQEWADRLAACAGGPEVIGEHSNVNNPWANALDLLRGDRR